MNNVPNWLAYFVVGMVMSVWTGAYVANYYDRTYVPPKGLTEAMLAIACFVLTGKFIAKAKQKADQKRNDEHEPPTHP